MPSLHKRKSTVSLIYMGDVPIELPFGSLEMGSRLRRISTFMVVMDSLATFHHFTMECSCIQYRLPTSVRTCLQFPVYVLFSGLYLKI